MLVSIELDGHDFMRAFVHPTNFDRLERQERSEIRRVVRDLVTAGGGTIEERTEAPRRSSGGGGTAARIWRTRVVIRLSDRLLSALRSALLALTTPEPGLQAGIALASILEDLVARVERLSPEEVELYQQIARYRRRHGRNPTEDEVATDEGVAALIDTLVDRNVVRRTGSGPFELAVVL